MFSELITRAMAQLDNELPFVVYRKPNESLVHAIFQKDAELHLVDDFSETGFVFAPFDSNSKPVLLPAHEVCSETFLDGKSSILNRITENLDQNEQHDFYVELVKNAIDEIQNKTFKKVVLSRKLEVACNLLPLDLFEKILATYENAFCYVWYHPKVGLWLGATPEILLRTHGLRLTTMSLAGTKPYLKGEMPIWGIKEMEEQKMVTDYIFNAIEAKVDDLKLSETKTVRAGNLWHLRTEVSGILKKNGLSEVIRVLHPTPAVCGVPLSKTKAFLLENENYDREFYTGFLGELNRGGKHFELKDEVKQTATLKKNAEKATELYVNLRCLRLVDATAQIYVGGGVTHDSIAEKEWQETVSKSKTMLRVLFDH